MSEITMNAATPIKPESYENLFILLSDKRMNKKSIDKILREDPKFAEWFKEQK